MKLSNKTIAALVQAEIKHVGDYFHLSAPQMPRKDYEQFAKVVAALRGEWQRSKQAHVFMYNPTNAIAEILASGEVPPVNPHDFFPTPIAEIESMIDWAELPTGEWAEPGIRILEPSAGDGRIAKMVRDHLPNAQIDCYEIDPLNQSILTELGFTIVGENFLAAGSPAHPYNYILMNPPFNNREYQKHIQKAWEWLDRQAILISIVPSSFRRDKAFRNFVFEFGQAVESEPFETTQIKCSTIKIEKFDNTHLWQPDNCGFDSHYHSSVQIALDGDFEFWDRLQNLDDATQIAEWIDTCVERLIVKKEYNLLFDDRVRGSVLRYVLHEKDPSIEVAIADKQGQLTLIL